MRQTLWSLFLLPSLMLAQRDTVEGTVVNGITGAPLSGVRVLIWKRGGPQYESDTDPAGRFRIGEISPGTYAARFDKEGFASLEQYSSESFQIGQGKQPPPARVALLPFARIRGLVLTPEGSPVANAEVEMSRSLRDAKLLSTVTNKEGEFAFESVSPGSYVLRAIPKVESPTVEGAATAEREPRMRLEATYYPSVGDFSQAEKITVQAGTELTGYDVHVQARAVYKIRGVVLNSAGEPAAHAFVRLIPKADSCSISSMLFDGVGRFASEAAGAEAGIETGDDGVFEFLSVRSGLWNFAAASVEGGSVVSALVADKDIDRLRIETEPYVHFRGAFEWGEKSEGTRDEFGMLFLCNLDWQLAFSVSPRPDGSIRERNLMPGRYRLVLAPYPVHGKIPDSILLGDRDVLGQEVELTSASPSIRVLYHATAGTLEGTVDHGDGAVVLLLPKPFAFPELPLGARCTTGGKFLISGVPPGDYYAVALHDIDTSAPIEPDFLRKLLPLATTITITKGSTATLDLSLSRKPE